MPRKLTVKTFTPARSSYTAKVRAKIAADPKQSLPAVSAPVPHPPPLPAEAPKPVNPSHRAYATKCLAEIAERRKG